MDEAMEMVWQKVVELRARMKAFADAKKALRQQFVLKAQAILAEVQVELWPSLERALTRNKTLPLGDLDGERTDLLEVLEGIELSAEQRDHIAPQLEAYELQLDSALKRRNEMLMDSDLEIDSALREGKNDRALSLVDRVSRARIAVRTTNDQFTEVIASELGGETGDQFRGSALAESFPQVYRLTNGQRALGKALELDELDADVREAIGAIASNHDMQLAEVNDRIARTLRRQQPNRLKEEIEQVLKIGEPGRVTIKSDVSDRIKDDFKARQQLDVRAMSSAYRLLSKGQVARLPRIPSVDAGEPVSSEDFEIWVGEDED